MSKVLVTESSLSGIAAAIRAKNGTQNTYKPGQMAAAIQAIPTGTTPTGTVNITQNGTVDVTDYASADVAVPNSYAAADEGKVVSNGALVAQTARVSEITENGTYDTTLNDEVTVNVSGGGGSSGVYVGTTEPSADLGSNGDYYYERANYEYGYSTTPGNNSSTEQSGYEFTANENINVIGLRAYVRGTTTATLYLTDSSGNIIKQITNASFVDGWNVALFDTPVQLTSGSNYIVQCAAGSNKLKYQSKSATVFSPKITGVRGRYGGLPGSTDSSNIYSADIVIGSDVYIVTKQYYKSSGAWGVIA